MNLVDAAIVGIVILAVLAGRARGFVAPVLAQAGAVIGILVVATQPTLVPTGYGAYAALAGMGVGGALASSVAGPLALVTLGERLPVVGR